MPSSCCKICIQGRSRGESGRSQSIASRMGLITKPRYLGKVESDGIQRRCQTTKRTNDSCWSIGCCSS
eukprot:2163779-Pyramimonas_sp.AAC.1